MTAATLQKDDYTSVLDDFKMSGASAEYLEKVQDYLNAGRESNIPVQQVLDILQQDSEKSSQQPQELPRESAKPQEKVGKLHKYAGIATGQFAKGVPWLLDLASKGLNFLEGEALRGHPEEDVAKVRLDYGSVGDWLNERYNKFTGNRYIPETADERIVGHGAETVGNILGSFGYGGLGGRAAAATEASASRGLLQGAGTVGKHFLGGAAMQGVEEAGSGLPWYVKEPVKLTAFHYGNNIDNPAKATGQLVGAGRAAIRKASDFGKSVVTGKNPLKLSQNPNLRTAQLAEKYGVEISPATVTGNKVGSYRENTAAKLPFTANAYIEQGKRVVNQTETAIQGVLNAISPAEIAGSEAVGSKTIETLTNINSELKSQGSNLYEVAKKTLGENASKLVLPSHAVEEMRAVRKALAGPGKSDAEKKVLSLIGEFNRAANRHGGALPLDELLNYQKRLFKPGADITGDPRNLLKRVREKIDVDLGEVAEDLGLQEFKNQLTKAKNFTRERKLTFKHDTVVNSIINHPGKPEAVLRDMGTLSKAKQIKKALLRTEEGAAMWNELRKEKAHEILLQKTNTDGELALSKFARATTTSLQDKQELLKVLLQDQYDSIKELGFLTKSIKEKNAFLFNNSNTALVTAQRNIGAEVGAMFMSVATGGDPIKAFQTYVALKGIPKTYAKVVNSPSYRKAFIQEWNRFHKYGIFDAQRLAEPVTKLAIKDAANTKK